MSIFLMPRLYVRYQNNPAVSFFTQNTHFVPQGEDPTVGDLIAAAKTAFAPLATAFLSQLSLHLPVGVSKATSGIDNFWFYMDNKNDTVTRLRMSCPISYLCTHGSDDRKPLIIKLN